MQTVIVYYSKHHNNTKKLLTEIEKQGNVTLIDVSTKADADLSGYDVIGFASGIYYQKFHDSVLNFAEKHLPMDRKVFLIYTCGVKRKTYTDAIQQVVASKNAQILGMYDCLGFDTFGPFKLVGGVAKGRPNTEDIAGAVNFFKAITRTEVEHSV